MSYIFGIGIIIVISLVIGGLIQFLKKPKKLKLNTMKVPKLLDYRHPAVLPLVRKLDRSLPPEFISKVKMRVLSNHPHWTDHDFEWRLFELKRYFILNSLLKSVPMFSEEVDEVWHEMLMFTKEYETFSNQFFGSFLHHTPNMEVVPIPQERAFFDWVYLQLFEPTPNSRILWGRFLNHPFGEQLLNAFRSNSEEVLLENYFSPNDLGQEVKRSLIHLLKEEILKAEAIYKAGDLRPFTRLTSESNYSYLLTAMVFYSVYEPENYMEEMNMLMPKEAGYGGSSTSGCSSFSCTSYNDHHHDGGGSDSSCSSSGCGSGCGGGCS